MGNLVNHGSRHARRDTLLDDVTRLAGEIGDRLEVVIIPKVEGPWDIHCVDRFLAKLEARHELRRALLTPRSRPPSALPSTPPKGLFALGFMR